MRIVRKILLVCLILVAGILYFGTESKIHAQTYYEINVELGYDNWAKYGRYIPIVIQVYSEEEFEGTISIQRVASDGSVQADTYPISIAANSEEIIKKKFYLFERNPDFEFVLKDSAGEEVKRKKVSINALNSDYTELFVGVIDNSGVAKHLFNQINLGEYSNTSFPYILTRTLSIKPSQIQDDFVYMLDSIDIIIITENSMSMLTEKNIEYLLQWVEAGHTLIMEYTSNVNEGFVELYERAYEVGRPENELWPGIWLFSTNHGTGRVGFFVSYLEESNFYTFANNNKELVGMVFAKTCPLEMINSIIDYDMYYADSDDTYEIKYMFNSAVGKPVPNIKSYIVVIAIYVFLVGPVVHLLVYRKRRYKVMLLLVIALAGGFSYVIYDMGEKTRFTEMFLQYATILNLEEDGTEETYICANLPYEDTYYMKASSNYKIESLIEAHNNVLDDAEVVEENGYAEFLYADNDIKVTLQNEMMFSKKYLKASRSNLYTDEWQMETDITYYSGVISGSITNKTDKDYEQLALIMYGKIVLLGELKSGESLSLDAAKIVTLPYYPDDAADLIAGITATSGKAVMTANAAKQIPYEELNAKSGILEYVIDKYFDKKNTKPVILGFASSGQEAFEFDERYETFGFTMIYDEIDVNTAIGKREYDRLDYTNVVNMDDNSTYDAYSNTTYGSWVRLQYNFSDLKNVAKIIFERDDNMQNEEINYYGAFLGEAFLYNYNTLVYDKIDITKEYFDISELGDYLLREGSSYKLMVLYNINTTGQYRYTEIRLPYVATIRRITYVENSKP